MNNDDALEVVTINQAAKMLGVSRERVSQFVYTGRLPAVKFGHQWMIQREDVNKMKRFPAGRPSQRKVS